jgi:hypothetical protein
MDPDAPFTLQNFSPESLEIFLFYVSNGTELDATQGDWPISPDLEHPIGVGILPRFDRIDVFFGKRRFFSVNPMEYARNCGGFKSPLRFLQSEKNKKQIN